MGEYSYKMEQFFRDVKGLNMRTSDFLNRSIQKSQYASSNITMAGAQARQSIRQDVTRSEEMFRASMSSANDADAVLKNEVESTKAAIDSIAAGALYSADTAQNNDNKSEKIVGRTTNIAMDAHTFSEYMRRRGSM